MLPVTPGEVAAAAHEMDQVRAEWQRAGGQAITPAHISHAAAQIDGLKAAIRQNSGWRHCGELPAIAYYRACSLVRKIGDRFAFTWHVTSLVLALAVTAVALPILALLTRDVLWTLGLGLLIVGLATVAFAVMCLNPLDATLNGLLEQRRRGRKARLASLAASREALARAERLHHSYVHQHQLASRHAELSRRHQDLLLRLKSRKNQLQLVDWRTLRDTDFERFLVDVFETLGYAVQTTKASGDQGVDLILAKGGRRVAVQAKGYAGAVGVSAVQEVVAGRGVYRCDSCAVVTNSRFTRGAKDCSRANSCQLVDGGMIPALIDGHVF
jgi:hypothetical protein